MNAYLDANADGLGLLLIFGCIAIVMLLIAWRVEWRMETRKRITRIDPRCERVGREWPL